MTIDQTKVVDFVNLDKTSTVVFLSISDHFVWDENEGEHLLLLQEKLNAYPEYITDGQLYTDFPQVKNKPTVIRFIEAYPISEQAQKFFDLAKAKLEKMGLQLKFRLLRSNENLPRGVAPALEPD